MPRTVNNATTRNTSPAVEAEVQPETGNGPAWVTQLSQVQLNLVLKHVPVLLWTTDSNLTISSGTGAYLAKLGLTAGTFVGMNLQDVLAHFGMEGQGMEDQALPAHLQALQVKRSVTRHTGRTGRSARPSNRCMVSWAKSSALSA
jgi:PAS domain-containing protein